MVIGKINRILAETLRKIADNIDCGNSNLSEDDAIEAVDLIKKFTDKTERLSKYAACKYLGISRATFDNYIRLGLVPKGEHIAGFKELFWIKKTLDESISAIRRYKQK